MSEGKSVRTVRIETEVSVRAPRARVFDAFCHEQLDWYPYTYGGERVKAVVLEPRVGGITYEDWGDGAGTLYGTVVWWDPPKSFAFRGHLRGAVQLEQWYTFEENDGVTVIKQSLVAFGDISDDDAEGIKVHGTLTNVEQKLRDWVERGVAVR